MEIEIRNRRNDFFFKEMKSLFQGVKTRSDWRFVSSYLIKCEIREQSSEENNKRERTMETKKGSLSFVVGNHTHTQKKK